MKKFIYALIVIVIVVIAGILIYRATTNKNSSNSTTAASSEPASLVSGDIAMPDAIATIYYGNGCPHCANLEKWLQDNKYLPSGATINQADVDSWVASAKVKFNIKEVWYNSTNSAELSAKATSLGIADDKVGVPFLYDSVNNKSYIGEVDIENFLSSK